MTFLDLQNLVAYWLDDLQFGYFTPAQVKLWLNNAQKEVQKRLIQAGQNYYLRCAQTTLILNQREYALPEDFKKEHRLELIISGIYPNETVSPLTPITLNQQDMVAAFTGTPVCYWFKRNRIVVRPTPDTAYVLRLDYSYQVADMVNDTDIPDVPESYAELIALLAAQDGFLKDGRASELLNKKISDYDATMKSDAQERNQDVSRSVVSTGDGYGSGGFYW